MIHDVTGSVTQYRAVQVNTRCYWVDIGWYWLLYDGTGSVQGDTGRYLVLLGQYNLVLLVIKCNWVGTRLLCMHILKKWRFGWMSP